MSSTVPQLLFPFAAGLFLGSAYLATLWLVVCRLPKTRYEGPWLIGSAIARISVLLVGFYWMMDGRWERLLACLVGYVVVRLAVTWRASGASAKHVTTC